LRFGAREAVIKIAHVARKWPSDMELVWERILSFNYLENSSS